MDSTALSLWVLAVLSACNCLPVREIDRLLIVSFDGFRNDFFNRSLTPNFRQLIRTSSYTERIVNVFPTQTFCNHFSIATGLYAEEHGVLSNDVMDNGSVVSYGYKLFHYKEDVTPIWKLNELAGGVRHSGCMMWPGCDILSNEPDVSYSVKFNLSISWEERVATAISWFTRPTSPANLVMMYFESPDQEEHLYGPDSAQTNEQIERADRTVGRILRALKTNNLTDVHVVFLSDHGMESVTKARIIDLSSILHGRGRSIGVSPVLQIFPEPGKMEELYSKLIQFSKENEHFDVYKKQDIPDHYRYKNCKRAPPILAVAKPRYGFHDLLHWVKSIEARTNGTVSNETEFGVHGYDPDLVTMQPFLIAQGSKFDSNFKVRRTVELYDVFSWVLGLKTSYPPAKASNPLANTVLPVAFGTTGSSTLRLALLSVASLIALATLFVVFLIFQRRQTVRSMGYTLVEKEEPCG